MKLKIIIIILLFLIIISGCLNYQDKCESGKCTIQKSCSVNVDCIISCGCECVAKNSICPENTAKGSCPIGGLECGCLNNKCTYDTPQKFLELATCAKLGEGIGSCVGCITKCCTGLKAMAYLKYNNTCIKVEAPSLGAICSKCGDGICDKQNNEDECNCPEDCQ